MFVTTSKPHNASPITAAPVTACPAADQMLRPSIPFILRRSRKIKMAHSSVVASELRQRQSAQRQPASRAKYAGQRQTQARH